jgi:hypothetical protein
MLLLAASGCLSTFDEVHYFKSVDRNKRPVNYYRVRVNGDTFLSSSRYVSGYYDEATLDAYFNTISQPQGGKLFPDCKHKAGTDDSDPNTSASEENNSPAKDDELTTEPLAPDKDGRKLVLLLSSNSDEIARGISALAQSNEVATTLSNLVGSGRLKDAISSARAADLSSETGDVLAKKAARELASVADGQQPAAKQRMLQLANDVADFIGPHKTFTKFEDAQAWLSDRRGRENP